MPPLTTPWARVAAILLVAHMAWIATPAQAENSREAIEAVRKHRAEAGQAQATPDGAHRAGATGKTATNRPFGPSADPTANPNLNLKSCMDHAGLSFTGRDRCFRQHCQGRWGEGDCPRQGGDVIDRSGANDRTPLGRCLKDAGANPFKRDACGWRHCNNKWDTPECAAVKPRGTPSAQ